MNLFVLKITGGVSKLRNRKTIKQNCFAVSTQIKKIMSFRIIKERAKLNRSTAITAQNAGFQSK